MEKLFAGNRICSFVIQLFQETGIGVDFYGESDLNYL